MEKLVFPTPTDMIDQKKTIESDSKQQLRKKAANVKVPTKFLNLPCITPILLGGAKSAPTPRVSIEPRTSGQIGLNKVPNNGAINSYYGAKTSR